MPRMFFTSHARDQFAARVDPLIGAHRGVPMLQRMITLAAQATKMRTHTASGDVVFRTEEPLAGFVVNRGRGAGWTCVTVLGPKQMAEYDNDPVAAAHLLLESNEAVMVEPIGPTVASLQSLLADVYVELSLAAYATPRLVELRSRIERAVTPEMIGAAQEYAGYYDTPASATQGTATEPS